MKLQIKYILKTKDMNNIFSKIQSIRMKIENHKFDSIYEQLMKNKLSPTRENYINVLNYLWKTQKSLYMWYVYFLKKYFSKKNLWKYNQ